VFSNLLAHLPICYGFIDYRPPGSDRSTRDYCVAVRGGRAARRRRRARARRVVAAYLSLSH
jgi:hypothetical protein